ncbi:permease [Desulfovibrio sp. JC010]|uniref:permease n=1 Tax=Desulfovibrio sp. JC010 TaxID=2593641 RepID=UPI0013D2A55B|nr:permease [Desulfovibrio sp. JC010]NDV25276.1 permease [Desulfovibrio sp. JC010]
MQDISIFAMAATSIFIEAAPFLLLGSFIGAVIEVLVSEETLLRFVPSNRAGQVAAGLFAGMLLPTCECGIVPVAKRLLLKNVPPRSAIPYMMAAPVVNPVVLGSTLFAFQGDYTVVALRVLMVIVPATILGFVLGDASPRDVLKPQPINLQRLGELEEKHSHDHGHGCGCGCGATDDNKFKAVIYHTGAEFMSMGRFLIFGAIVAAGFKTFLPPEILDMFTAHGWLAITGLMVLAILLSICSEADAFVAASFVSFPVTAKVAFMAIGPMVDLKLIPMFFAVFSKRVAGALVVVPTVIVYAMALIMNLGGQ